MKPKANGKIKTQKPSIFKLLKPYSGMISALLFFALLSNGLNLVIPKLIQAGIDDFTNGVWNMRKIVTWFSAAAILIFILTYVQSIIQTFASEKVARDLRNNLSSKISENVLGKNVYFTDNLHLSESLWH